MALVDKKIVDVILEIPPNFKPNDELFDFKPIKAKRSYSTYSHKVISSLNFIIQSAHTSKKQSNNLESSSGTKTKNVLIKNIGNMKLKHLKNALDYAIKNSDDGFAFNEDFERVNVQDILDDWKYDFDTKRDLNEAMHLVFSLKEEATNKEVMHALLISTFETMKNGFSDYKFALIPHTHQKRPHIHIILNKNNQLTDKKLRFSGRSDCRDFFNSLREDFAYNIGLFSDGRMQYQYTNEPNLRILDKLEQQIQQIKSEVDYFDYDALMKQVLSDLNFNYQKLSKDNVLGDSSNSEQLQKRQDKINNIKDNYREINDFAINFHSYCREFSSLQKKEALLHKFNCLNKRMLNKQTIQTINNLKNEVELLQSKNKNLVSLLSNSVGKNTNKPLNMIQIKKSFYRLRNLSFMLSKVDLEDEQKSSFKEIINRTQKELLELALERFRFISQCFVQNQEESKEKWREFDKKLKEEQVFDKKLFKKALRKDKDIKFNALELLHSQKLLAFSKDFNSNMIIQANKEIDRITQEKREMQQDLDNVSPKPSSQTAEMEYTTKKVDKNHKNTASK